jgi:hypothetical protein
MRRSVERSEIHHDVTARFAAPLCALQRTAINGQLNGQLAFHLHLFHILLVKLQSLHTYKYSSFSVVTSVRYMRLRCLFVYHSISLPLLIVLRRLS